jgi:hypothetical protein
MLAAATRSGPRPPWNDSGVAPLQETMMAITSSKSASS